MAPTLAPLPRAVAEEKLLASLHRRVLISPRNRSPGILSFQLCSARGRRRHRTLALRVERLRACLQRGGGRAASLDGRLCPFRCSDFPVPSSGRTSPYPTSTPSLQSPSPSHPLRVRLLPRGRTQKQRAHLAHQAPAAPAQAGGRPPRPPSRPQLRPRARPGKPPHVPASILCLLVGPLAAAPSLRPNHKRRRAPRLYPSLPFPSLPFPSLPFPSLPSAPAPSTSRSRPTTSSPRCAPCAPARPRAASSSCRPPPATTTTASQAAWATP